jgi:hypothetical protein
MATKAPPKLDIQRTLRAVDQKNYDFYDSLTDDEKKAFSPFILMRYTSNVAIQDVQAEFVERTNEFVNKHYSVISKNHKPLMWKLYAGVGVGANCYHPYLAAGKKEKANKIEKLLCEIYPAMKMCDIKMLARMMTKKDREELFADMGFDKKQRKAYE